MTRYLKQAKSNYVTIWAPVAAKRLDQVEISEAEALSLLKEQVKTKQQRMKEGTWVEPSPGPTPHEPAVVEKEEAKVDMTEDKAEVKPEAPGLPEEPKPDDDLDPEIKMLEEIRVKGKGKVQVEAYMIEKHGINVDRRFKLNELVDQAVAARTAELANKYETPVE